MELTAEHLVNFLETPGVHVLVHTCVCVCACAGLHPTRSSNLRTSRSRARAWEAKVAARFLKEGRQEGRIDQPRKLGECGFHGAPVTLSLLSSGGSRGPSLEGGTHLVIQSTHAGGELCPHLMGRGGGGGGQTQRGRLRAVGLEPWLWSL